MQTLIEIWLQEVLGAIALKIYSGLPDFRGRLPAGLPAVIHEFAMLLFRGGLLGHLSEWHNCSSEPRIKSPDLPLLRLNYQNYLVLVRGCNLNFQRKNRNELLPFGEKDGISLNNLIICFIKKSLL